MPLKQDREQHDREQQVHERPAEHDDDALPHRQPVEDAVVVVAQHRLVVGGARVLHHRREEAAARTPGPPRARDGDGGYMPAIEM